MKDGFDPFAEPPMKKPRLDVITIMRVNLICDVDTATLIQDDAENFPLILNDSSFEDMNNTTINENDYFSRSHESLDAHTPEGAPNNTLNSTPRTSERRLIPRRLSFSEEISGSDWSDD